MSQEKKDTNKDDEATNLESNDSGRRNFLKYGLLAAGITAVGGGLSKIMSKDIKENPDTTVFTRDGKVYKADTTHLHEYSEYPISNAESRIGIPGKKFVMVIDLAKCDGCKACTIACQKMHYIPSDREWIKVFTMQESETTAPYYFPKPCYHCDNPPCTKVCPVGATYKRQDGIVLVDHDRCIGCRSCMAACPYSTRFFNWTEPVIPAEIANTPYSPEQGFPSRIGVTEKCDFCPHMIREGKMPSCVSSCPMDAIYFGDENENAVTNASGVTVKFSELVENNAGYRHLEELGTKPRVYYLPPKNRKYPVPDMDKANHENAAKLTDPGSGKMQM